MKPRPNPISCPILEETRGFNRTVLRHLKQLQEDTLVCAECPRTGECFVLAWLTFCLKDVVNDMDLEREIWKRIYG